jgi:enamine deaminase RidA (YjgF/YER057c/UK114 family)
MLVAPNRFLDPKALAKPPGYTYVVETSGPGRTIYLAGQLGLDIDNKIVGAPGDFKAQCEKAFENLGSALSEVGARPEHVVKIVNYVTDMSFVKVYHGIRDSFFSKGPPPASTLIGVTALARPGAVFEIDAIAVVPE